MKRRRVFVDASSGFALGVVAGTCLVLGVALRAAIGGCL